MYRGDIRLGDTIDVKFTTRAFATGAPTTLAGSPVISAYVGNGTTEITAGITLTVDFDSRTGLHNIRVVASSGNGFATASDVDLVITAGTVGGTSVVGEVVGSFSIEHRSALMPTTAAVTLDVAAGGEAGIDWGNVANKTTTNALTNTSIVTTQKVDVDTIKTNPVVNAGTVTFPTTATLASTANITAATGVDITKILGTAISTPATAGILDVNAKNWNNLATVALPLIPTVAGRTLDVSAGGEAGVDWANVGSPTTTVDLSGTTIKTTQKVDVDTIKTNPVVNGGTLTFPTTATLASTTNITAGTITTATNLTTNNDKTGYGLSSAAVQAIWDALTSALTTAGSIGKWIVDKLDVVVSTRTKPADTQARVTLVDTVTTNTDMLTQANVRSAVGLASANLDTQLGNIRTDTNTTIPALIAALNNLSTAQVKTQVTDALNVDTYAQPGQGTPAATTTLTLMIRYLYKAWRNKSTQTATDYDLYNDDAVTVDQKASFADDGTVCTRGEITTGP